MATISACLVVHTEEGVIDRCLGSLDGVVDEIVLVHDGPCTDRTLEIAERHGCRIVVAEWIGNCEPHRPLSFRLATGDWILRIDADEFLSDELRAAMPELVARADVAGWKFDWPIWSHSKGTYVTRNGPYKTALTRRAATVRAGVPSTHGHVRGRVEQVPLLFEHRPLYDHYRPSVNWGKWKRRARIHAQVYLMDWDDIPKFGYEPGSAWSRRRVWGNRLAPLLIVPYGVMELLAGISDLRRMRPAWRILQVAGVWALYAMLVQVYVVKYRFVERSAGRVPPGIATARSGAD